MNAISAAIMGFVQGMTEFLPVSSSAHLAVFHKILNINVGLMLEVIVHFGTALAVILIYRKQIWEIINSFFLSISKVFKKKSTLSREYATSLGFRYMLFLIGTSIPAALIGYLFEDSIANVFSSLKAVGVGLLITGVILWISDKFKTGNVRGIFQMNMKHALLIGLAQGIAIMPGISRSGMTICMALFLGLDRETSANYSFIASLPVILGATLFQVAKGGLTEGSISAFSLLLALVVSFICGVFAVKFVKVLVKNNKYKYFSYYVWLLGTVLIIFF